MAPEHLKPNVSAFEDSLEASLKGVPDVLRQSLKKVFGEQISIEGDTVRWWAKPHAIASPAPVPGWPGLGGRAVKLTVQATGKQTKLQDALTAHGINSAGAMTDVQASALISSLREQRPVKAKQIATVNADPAHPLLTAKFISATVQEFLAFLPRRIVKALPKLNVESTQPITNLGEYERGGLVKLSDAHTTAEVARETIFHELAHWLHMELPASNRWVAGIMHHFELRTRGEPVVHLGGNNGTGKRDKWWHAYMGRIYGRTEEQSHLGLEFVTKNFELLADPVKLAQAWSSSQAARDDIMLAFQILFA